MPKQRQTCTRCSQRRQKCDRKEPCSRCVQHNEGHLCSTRWMDGYDPSLHRKYPRKSSPTVSWHSIASSSPTSSGGVQSSESAAVPDVASLRETTSRVVRTPASESPNLPTRLPDLTIGALLLDKDQSTQSDIFNQSIDHVKFKGASRETNGTSNIASCYSLPAKVAEIQHLQSILPSRELLMQIVDYYEHYMLYWTGGLYHGPTFRKTLLDAYGSSGTLDLQTLDWRWTALLFSILSSGVIGSSETISMSWGLSNDDKIRLARAWGVACVASLNLGHYTIQYHLYSVQAIYIIHAYEHLVGSTNQWVSLRSVAVVIARSLGLHKLGPHPDDSRVNELNPVQKQAFIEREIGRRTWYLLTCQEWLWSSTQNRVPVSIQKRHFTTTLPQHLDEETMTPIIDPTVPSLTHVGNYFFDYATLLLDFYNVMQDAEDKNDIEKYALILKFDGELRAICAGTPPNCLSPRVAYNSNWPRWVGWARKLHQASIHHKIIMVHQSYLSKSFKDVRYTYTRWACATSAKTIINIYTTRDPDEPQWWVEQAFVVTAGICLVLDLFHRAEGDWETQEYLNCVEKAIRHIQQFSTSTVAVHGVRLLKSLLQEYSKLQEKPKANPPLAVEEPMNSIPTYGADFVLPESVRSSQDVPPYPEMTSFNEDSTQFNFDIDALGFEDLMDYLPAEAGLNNQVFLDSMYTVTQ